MAALGPHDNGKSPSQVAPIMAETYEDILQQSLNDNNQYLKDSFAYTATAYGWPKDIIDNIELVFHDNDIHISYDDQFSQQLSDLEYGNIETPAKAAIRNFTGNIDDDLMSIFSDYGIDSLFKRGVFS